jgi:hypothetical protein
MKIEISKYSYVFVYRYITGKAPKGQCCAVTTRTCTAVDGFIVYSCTAVQLYVGVGRRRTGSRFCACASYMYILNRFTSLSHGYERKTRRSSVLCETERASKTLRQVPVPVTLTDVRRDTSTPLLIKVYLYDLVVVSASASGRRAQLISFLPLARRASLRLPREVQLCAQA